MAQRRWMWMWMWLAAGACAATTAGRSRETLDPRSVEQVPYPLVEERRVEGRADEVPLPAGTHKVYLERRRLQPAVALSVCIDRDGRVARVEHVAPADRDADYVQPREVSAAFAEHYEREVGRWRFRPFERDGKPVPVCTRLVLHYNLRQNLWGSGERGR